MGLKLVSFDDVSAATHRRGRNGSELRRNYVALLLLAFGDGEPLPKYVSHRNSSGHHVLRVFPLPYLLSIHMNYVTSARR